MPIEHAWTLTRNEARRCLVLQTFRLNSEFANKTSIKITDKRADKITFCATEGWVTAVIRQRADLLLGILHFSRTK